MYYVVLSVGKDDGNDTHVIGIFTDEAEAVKWCKEAEAAYLREHPRDAWAPYEFEIDRVPELHVRGIVNYRWSPFRDEPAIKWQAQE